MYFLGINYYLRVNAGKIMHSENLQPISKGSHMKLKRTRTALAAMIAGALAVGSLPLTAIAAPSDEIQAQLNDVFVDLQNQTIELEIANNELDSIRTDLIAVQDEIEQTEQKIAEKQVELEEAKAMLSNRVSSSYKSGGVNILSVIVSSTDFEDMISRVFYANKLVEADEEAIAEVQRIQQELEDEKAGLLEQEAQQQELVDAQEAKTAEIQGKVNSLQSYYNDLDQQLKDALAEEEAARKAAEEAARRQAEEAARRQQQAQQNAGSGSGSSSQGGGSSKPSYGSDSGSAPSSVTGAALAQVGKPYVWGTAGPSTFDCSGLMVYAYGSMGYSLPHSSQAQFNRVANLGHLVYDPSALSPGDLVFWGYSSSSIYHVGMYIGGGQYVHASMPGVGVVVSSLSTSGTYMGGGSPV